MKIELVNAIESLGGSPYLWQIEEYTGFKSNNLRSQLREYPEHLNISLSEKKILDVWEPGMTFDELSKHTNISQNTVRNIVVRLSKRGLLNFSTAKYDTSGDKNVYVRVVTNKTFRIKIYGAKRTTDVTLKNCGGYIVPENGKKTACIIYKNCVPYRIRVDMSDIKIIEKHKFGGKK